MTRRYSSDALDLAGPTARELAAIEAEWPQIAAGLDEVDRDIDAILAAETLSATPVPADEHRPPLWGGIPAQGKTAAVRALALASALDADAPWVGGVGQGKTSPAAVILAGLSYAEVAS